MPMIRNLAALATAAAAARSYARKNPNQASKYVDQAAAFVDKQTRGKYSSQITGAARKAKEAAGIRSTPGAGPDANGYTPGQSHGTGQPAGGQSYGTGPTGSTQPGGAPGTPTN